MTIAMKEVKSSQIEAIGYDDATSTLAIRFKCGSVYHYNYVPQNLFDELSSAESVGSFFGKHIKPHADLYPFKKQPKVEKAAE
jgi:KTSC domain